MLIVPLLFAIAAQQSATEPLRIETVEEQAFETLCAEVVGASTRPEGLVRPTMSKSFACVEAILRALRANPEREGIRMLAHSQLWNVADVVRTYFAATGQPHPVGVPLLEALVRDSEHPLRKEARLALTIVRDPGWNSLASLQREEDVLIDPDELETERTDFHPLYLERLEWYLATFTDILVNNDAPQDPGVPSFWTGMNIGNLAGLSTRIQELFLARQFARRRVVSPGASISPSGLSELLPTAQFRLSGRVCAGRNDCEDFRTPQVADGQGVGGGQRDWKHESGGTASYSIVTLEHVGNILLPSGKQYGATVTSYVRGGHRAGDLFNSREDQKSSLTYTLTANATLPECKSIANCAPVVQLHFWSPAYSPSLHTQAYVSVKRGGTELHRLTANSVVELDRVPGPLVIELTMSRSEEHVGASGEPQGLIHQAAFTLLLPNPDPAGDILNNMSSIEPLLPEAPREGTLEHSLSGGLDVKELIGRSRWLQNVAALLNWKAMNPTGYVPIGELLVRSMDVADANFDTRTSTLYAKLLAARLLLEQRTAQLSGKELDALRQAEAILSARARQLYRPVISERIKDLKRLSALVNTSAIDAILRLLLTRGGLASVDALRDPELLRVLSVAAGTPTGQRYERYLMAFDMATESDDRLAAVVALQALRTELDTLKAVLIERVALLQAEAAQLADK